MRGFEITRSEFFDSCQRPYVILQDKKIKFSTACVRKFDKNNCVEFLVNPHEMKFAVRTAGNYKVSYNNLVALSMMDTNEIQELGKKVAQSPLAFIRYSESRKNITGETPAKLPGPVPETPAIKTMPAYDPDAEVAGLTLTIPSWMSSIERTKKTADLNVISPSAKDKLEEALEALQNKVQEMLVMLSSYTFVANQGKEQAAWKQRISAHISPSPSIRG